MYCPALLLHVALDLIRLGRGGSAGFEEAQERGLGADGHPLRNKGLQSGARQWTAQVSRCMKFTRMRIRRQYSVREEA
jgi:hypothetical protein